MIKLKKDVKTTTFPAMLSSPPIEKQLNLELSMMHQQKSKKDARVSMSVCTVVLSSRSLWAFTTIHDLQSSTESRY